MRQRWLLLITLACGPLAHAQAQTPNKLPVAPPPGQELTVCTTLPAAEWMEQQDFKAILAARGYRVSKFKVSRGNCFEIYGFDSRNRIVEVYFNPTNARIVRSNVIEAPAASAPK